MGLTFFDGYIYLSFVMVSYRFDIRDRLAFFLFIHMDDDPYGLLEFGIGVLNLEADQAFTILI